MFENPSAFLKIFSILLIIALFIYRIQLFALIRERGKKKGNSRRNVKVDEFLSQHDLNLINELGIKNRYKEIVPPIFHILKVTSAENYLSLYFSNRGGNIFNIEVKSSEVSSISIEPQVQILNKETGCIKIFTYDHNKDISFELFYSDDFTPIRKNKFKYLFANKKITQTN